MGSYTRISLKIKLKSNTPDYIIAFFTKTLIDHDIGLPPDTVLYHSGDVPKPQIDHPFFLCERWPSFLLSNNFDPKIPSSFIQKTAGGNYILSIESECKAYGSICDKFIDWLTPYVASRKKKQYIGWLKHEEMQDRIYLHINCESNEKANIKGE